MSIFKSTKVNRVDFDHVSGMKGGKSPKILTIRVDGVILADKPTGIGGLFGSVSGYGIQEILRVAEKDDRIKAVVVQFSTGGGSVPGSNAIFDGICHYREATGNPIVAHVEGLSASGGVFAMVGADRIYAEPGSLIGSIGVTMGTRRWFCNPTAILPAALSEGVETKGGVKTYVLAGGKGKDLFSEWRAPSDEEIEVIERQLNALYDFFVAHVSSHRRISAETIRDEMGAYVFANPDALRLGLIDETKTRRGVIETVAAKVGLGFDDVEVVRAKIKAGGWLSKILKAEAPEVPASGVGMIHGPMMLTSGFSTRLDVR